MRIAWWCQWCQWRYYICQGPATQSSDGKSVLRAETPGLWSWAASSEKALLAIGILMKRWVLAGGNYHEDHDVRMTLPSKIIIIIIIIIIICQAGLPFKWLQALLSWLPRPSTAGWHCHDHHDHDLEHHHDSFPSTRSAVIPSPPPPTQQWSWRLNTSLSLLEASGSSPSSSSSSLSSPLSSLSSLFKILV